MRVPFKSGRCWVLFGGPSAMALVIGCAEPLMGPPDGGTTGGDGGSTTSNECTPDDLSRCGAPAEPACAQVACEQGKCIQVAAPAGAAVGDDRQTAGDCQRVVCDGHGSLHVVPDDGDPPDDGNTCTLEGCHDGVPASTPAPAGTPCALIPDGVCSGGGVCVVCVPGMTKACYDGPPGTEGIGICTAGTATCVESGLAYGPCTGEVTPKVEVCSTPADEDCDGIAAACTGDTLWSTHWGGLQDDAGNAIASDSAGNVYVAGYFSGAVDFGGSQLTSAGAEDAFLVKLGPSGDVLWAKRYGDAAGQQIRRIAVDTADDVVVTGSFAGSIDLGGGALVAPPGKLDIFVAKLAPDGSHLWSKRFGADHVYGSRVAVDAGGNVLVAGDFAGTANFGGGPVASAGLADVFLVKLDPAGNHLWSRRFGDGADQYAWGVAADGAGNVVLTGPYYGAIDFGGGALVSQGLSDIAVAKFDPSGAPLWSRRFGGASHDQSYGVAVGPGGEIALIGFTQGALQVDGFALSSAGNADVLVARFDAAGHTLWAKVYGDGLNQDGAAIAMDAAGDLLIGGEFAGTIDLGGGSMTSAGPNDAFVAKLGSAGNHIWSQHYGMSGYQVVYGVALDPGGNALIAGYYHGGNIDLGNGTFVCAGASDVFAAKLAP